MYIYKLLLELKERVFFASREIHDLFQTEPVIGNYALCYATGLAKSPYHIVDTRKSTPTYKEDISHLNEKGIYITPATPVKPPEMELERFNAMVDSYWYAMSNNAVVADLEVKIKGKRAPTTCFPQSGKIRFLARGSIFKCFLISTEEIRLPYYIRLGKFMSKVKLNVEKLYRNLDVLDIEGCIIPFFLNPLDMGENIAMKIYDLMSIHPVPLIYNIEASGKFYKLDDNYLPVGMRFVFP